MRILIFGCNGSGKGTQSAHLIKSFGLAHVESGGIFREHIGNNTDLGKQAKTYIEKGELVPDSITIPMVLDRLAKDDCQKGWILDGFPRTPEQSKALIKGLEEADTPLDVMIVIELDREEAKKRLLGRRTCPNGHPNNIAIPAIASVDKGGVLHCWKCDAEVTVRKDDVDEAAIDQRHDIFFDDKNGTVAAIQAVASWLENRSGSKTIKVDGSGEIAQISETISKQLSA